VGGRLPKTDETSLAVVEIYSLDAVKVNLAYLDQLKALFTTFIHVNLNVGKKTVNWKDIEEKNITMIARSFLKLCRYKDMIPHLFNIEKLAEFMESTLPPITQGEIDYYDNTKLKKEYDDDKNYQTTMVEPMINDKGEVMEPALHFHEFLFLLGLIAKNCMPGKLKDGSNVAFEDNSIQTKLREFYT
jgi:hypothetical protein